MLDGKKHILNREDNVKGGQSTSIAKKLHNREYCRPKCPIYSRCAFMQASQKLEGKPCGYKKLPPALRGRYIKIMTGSPDDFGDVLKDMLGDLQNRAKRDNNFRNDNALLQSTINVMQALYGKKIYQQVENLGVQEYEISWKERTPDQKEVEISRLQEEVHVLRQAVAESQRQAMITETTRTVAVKESATDVLDRKLKKLEAEEKYYVG